MATRGSRSGLRPTGRQFEGIGRKSAGASSVMEATLWRITTITIITTITTTAQGIGPY